MTRVEASAIAVGGAAGATVRWALGEGIDVGGGWPWPTFVANLVGCALLGAVAGLRPRSERSRIGLQGLLGVGFCGGLTTFSTFAVEVAELGRDDRPELAAAYLVASLALGVGLAAAARVAIVGRLRHRPC